MVKIPGMYICDSFKATIEKKWKTVYNKIHNVLISNKINSYNLIQKLWFINTFALSKIWYL